MESVTDTNYEEFKNSPRAVLLVSTSWCQQCKEYLPTIITVAKQMDFIRFGKTVLDEGRSIKLKKEYPDVTKSFPSTVFFKEQKRIGKIHGAVKYPELVSKIQEYLILGATVFIPSSDGIYVPASIQQIKGTKGTYLVRCEEDSPLGRKGTPVWIPGEKIKWGLEAKV